MHPVAGWECCPSEEKGYAAKLVPGGRTPHTASQGGSRLSRGPQHPNCCKAESKNTRNLCWGRSNTSNGGENDVNRGQEAEPSLLNCGLGARHETGTCGGQAEERGGRGGQENPPVNVQKKGISRD